MKITVPPACLPAHLLFAAVPSLPYLTCGTRISNAGPEKARGDLLGQQIGGGGDAVLRAGAPTHLCPCPGDPAAMTMKSVMETPPDTPPPAASCWTFWRYRDGQTTKLGKMDTLRRASVLFS